MPRARQPDSAESKICDAIRAAILERRLVPGTKLQEVPLGAFFGVSRTIVRQALRRLDHEGVVSLRAKRVAVVAKPSADDVRHAFGARQVIEIAAVSTVAARATAADLQGLKRLVAEENAAYARGDRRKGLALSLGFHHRLADLSGNPILARYLRELVLKSSLAIALYEKDGVVHERADHDALVDALLRRDAKRASRLMATHLEELERRLVVATPEQETSLAAIFGPR